MANHKNNDSTPKAAKSFRTNYPEKYEYAFMLFMQKVSQKDICERVGVTANTISEWKEKGQWEMKRTASLMSMDDTFNRLLVKINECINKENFNPDDLSKLVAAFKAFKKDTTTDDTIVVFMKFQTWLIQNKHIHKSITEEFVKGLVALQDYYVKFLIGNKGGI